MTLIVFIVIALAIVGIYLFERQNKKWEKEGAEKEKQIIQRHERFAAKRKEKQDRIIAELKQKYGDVPATFKFGDGLHTDHAFIFEESEVIATISYFHTVDIIPFSSIVDYEAMREGFEADDNTMTTVTSTSTGSLIGRSVVGGLLFGPLGAGVGAMTAKRESITTMPEKKLKYKYSIKLTLDSLSDPRYEFQFGVEQEWFEKALGIISVIMNRKREGRYQSIYSDSLQIGSNTEMQNGVDLLFEEVAHLIMDVGSISASSLQRRYGVNYLRAEKILEQLESAGILGPGHGGRPREVLLGPDEIEEILSNMT